MAANRYRLGIDLGTSSTVAVLAGRGGAREPLLFDSSPLLSSAVCAGPGSLLLTGADAERAALANPGGFEPNPKRRIDDGSIWLDREYQVADLLAAVLDRVAGVARGVAGELPTRVVLSHPAGWGRHRLAVLNSAADLAGLHRLRFVSEPVAAAAYFTEILGQQIPPDQCLVVYDFGAGTFDLAVVRPGSAGFEVVATTGRTDIGGLDLDAVVVDHARSLTEAGHAAAWDRLDRPQTMADRHARHLLWQGARAVKEQLSRHSSADLHVPLVDRQLHLTRAEFERLTRPLLDRTVTLTVETLHAAQMRLDQVGAVFLVGGSSRVPEVATLLHRSLRVAPTVIAQPELVVAHGCLLSSTTPAPSRGTRSSTQVRPAGSGRPDPVRSHAVSRAQTIAEPAPDGSATRSRPSTTTVGSNIATTKRHRRPLDRPTRTEAGSGKPPRSGWTRRAVVITVLATPALVAVGAALNQDDRLISTLEGHTDAVTSLMFSPDGSMLASAGYDRSVRLWNLTDHKTIGKFDGNLGNVTGLAFNVDASLLASCDDDSYIRLWNVRDRRQYGPVLTGHRDGVFAVVFSADGGSLLSVGADNVRRWPVSNGADQPAGAPTVNTGIDLITSATLTTDGGTIAIGTGRGAVNILNPATPNGAALTGHDAAVYTVALHPDGRTLASCGVDGTVRLWDLATRQPIGTPWRGHDGSVYDISFGPAGHVLASGGSDGTVRLWDVSTGRPTGSPLRGHDGAVTAVAFSQNGRLASGGDDDTVRLWRAF